MSKTLNLTESQLDFISYMKASVASEPTLKERVECCLSKLVNQNYGQTPNTNSEIILYHSPKSMIEFLSLFSRDDRFKWYTHKWDMTVPFEINELKNKQTADKSVLSRMAFPVESGPAINERTYNQVWNFINFNNIGKKIYVWKNNKLENMQMGWHSVFDLSKDQADIPVEFIILEDGHQFKDYIRMFKSVIEFRTDLDNEDRFSELVWRNLKSSLPKDFDVRFLPNFDEIGYDLNVYCDVVGIVGALNILCNWMTKHKTRSSQVSVNLNSSSDYYILEISHIGSYFNNIDKLRIPSGDLEELRKKLFSVCDFSMEGDYIMDGHRQKSLIVMVMDASTTISRGKLSPCRILESDKTVGGVKYKFKIFKR